MFFALTVFYIFYFILLSYFTDDKCYPIIRKGIVVGVMVYYLVEGYYTDYTDGLIWALVINFLICCYIAVLSLFKEKAGQIIKGIIVALGVLFIIIVHAFSDFARFGGSGPIVVNSIENERFLVEEIRYDNAGPYSHEYSGEIYYVDKSQFPKDKNKLILLPYFSNRSLSFKFKDETNLQIDLNVGESSLEKIYYEPIVVDLTSEPGYLNYKYYDAIHKVDTAKALKDLEIISNAYNDTYAMTFRRLKAKENQVEGDYVITYGSIYQEEAEILFDVHKGDYVRFEFITDSKVQIIYYSNIPLTKNESNYDVILDYSFNISKNYNHIDSYVFDYNEIPNKNLLQKRREVEAKKRRRN